MQVQVVAVRRRQRGPGGGWRRELYAFDGVTPAGAVRRYQRARFYRLLMRKRFGIETSYRQMNQGQALTTSVDQRVRLWWVGLALLLRQVWVWLQQQLAQRGTAWKHWKPSGALTVAILLDWLAGWLKERYPSCQAIPLPQPLQLPFAEAVNG